MQSLYAQPSLSSELLTSAVAAAEFRGSIGSFILRKIPSSEGTYRDDYLWIKFPPVEETCIFLSNFKAV